MPMESPSAAAKKTDGFKMPKPDTIAKRNQRVQKYTPEQYNQIYHLKNLKNIELIGGKPTPEAILSELVSGTKNTDLNLDNYWIESSCRAHICNGRIFSIATNRINNKKVNKEGIVQNRIQKTSLAIYVHDPKDAEGRHSVKLFEKVLWFNDQPHNWHSVSKPAVINQNKMYFATFQNFMEPDFKIKHQIWCFDFDTCVAPTEPLFEREEKMVLDKNINKYHYACQTMLSIYVPIDKATGDIDLNQVLTEEEFMKNTFVSVRYRTNKENEEKEDQPGFQTIIKSKKEEEESDEEDEGGNGIENKYYSSVNVYHLKDFAQSDWGGKVHIVHEEEAFKGSSDYKDSDIFPQIQFVMNGQFYILKKSKKMQIGQMEIEEGEDENAGKTFMGHY